MNNEYKNVIKISHIIVTFFILCFNGQLMLFTYVDTPKVINAIKNALWGELNLLLIGLLGIEISYIYMTRNFLFNTLNLIFVFYSLSGILINIGTTFLPLFLVLAFFLSGIGITLILKEYKFI